MTEKCRLNIVITVELHAYHLRSSRVTLVVLVPQFKNHYYKHFSRKNHAVNSNLVSVNGLIKTSAIIINSLVGFVPKQFSRFLAANCKVP